MSRAACLQSEAPPPDLIGRAKANGFPVVPLKYEKYGVESSTASQKAARGFRVMVRYSKGQDIAAACGQLIVRPAAEAGG